MPLTVCVSVVFLSALNRVEKLFFYKTLTIFTSFCTDLRIFTATLPYVSSTIYGSQEKHFHHEEQ
jgi:hypothetical protein